MSAAVLPLFAIVPLLLSGLTVLVRHPVLDRVLLIGVPLASATGGLLLLLEHRQVPVLAHGVGGFVPGVSIPFVSDALSALMLTVTGISTAACSWFLVGTGEDRYRFVPPLALMLTGGVNGALLTGDLFNLFVFVEVMLLPSYALIAVTGTWRRLGIGRLFILVNLLTSTFLLIGIGFVYGVTGTVNLAALAGQAARDPRAGLALAVVLMALAIKGGVVPVHGWLPRSYPATSAAVMALFAGLHTKVALYAIYRVYAMGYGGRPAPWLWVLLVVAVLTMVVGAVSTINERRIRAALAFQMVSGVGHILLGLVVFTAASLAAGIFYLVHHVITMAALLLSAGAIEHTYGSGRFDRLSGLMRRDRLVTIVFALGLFSLVGLPPTSGVWGKVALMASAAGAPDWQSWVLIGAVVVASLASLMALQRLWAEVFWGPPMERYRPDDPHTGRGEAIPLPDAVVIRPGIAAPGAVMLVLSVALFLAAGLVWPFAQSAGAGLLEVGPYVSAVLK
ncbi:MAG: monovalent cation/H+ antiporter subunit D family protein [Austwickia sp.]|nr:monovalent cation/H+ antiporter subunit D family protein [Austwickia sp.]MBK9101463.1 monovalent cation/H+ antiporter subunit D family protein [Austwickia sp.]